MVVISVVSVMCSLNRWFGCRCRLLLVMLVDNCVYVVVSLVVYDLILGLRMLCVVFVVCCVLVSECCVSLIDSLYCKLRNVGCIVGRKVCVFGWIS